MHEDGPVAAGRAILGPMRTCSRSSSHRRFALAALVVLGTAAPALAADTLTVSDPIADRPTVTTLGVQLPIAGDDNFNASVTVRYRAGAGAWSTALPLLRVHPETVQSHVPPAQFAGSVFDLLPATSYEIELHAVDPDGGDFVKSITATTRAVPGDPPSPHVVNVTTTAALQTALDAAVAGDVIVLADGTYGPYVNISRGGAAGNPVVVRGATQGGVVLDGGNCTPCNVVEVYGAGWVHLENLTIANAQRAVRVQTAGTQGNVFRRLHVKNVVLGIGTKADANDYYVADNILEGRLTWPNVYATDGGVHANDDGINLAGSGNVIAFNRLSGFGDAMKTEQSAVRANDFYGNDVLFTYDNGVELDNAAGNVRAFRNRFTNTYATTSFQPIYGGPAYLFRNVIVNVADEPFKLHALGGDSETSGGYIVHNTVVKSGSSLQVSTPAASHNFVIENNLFVANPGDGYAVRWDQPVVAPTMALDYNGYFPDGKFELGYSNVGLDKTYDSFAAVVAAGRFEAHGLLVGASNFAGGLATPSAFAPLLPPADVALAATSAAIDRARAMPNLNDAHVGAAADIGALEYGCAAPSYGPRPIGVDERTPAASCGATIDADGGTEPPGLDGGEGDGAMDPAGDGGAVTPERGGCACRYGGGATSPGTGACVLACAIAWALRRRARVTSWRAACPTPRSPRRPAARTR